MPLYEYKCAKCGHTFEWYVPARGYPDPMCPKCNGHCARQVTAPGLVQGPTPKFHQRGKDNG